MKAVKKNYLEEYNTILGLVIHSNFSISSWIHFMDDFLLNKAAHISRKEKSFFVNVGSLVFYKAGERVINHLEKLKGMLEQIKESEAYTPREIDFKLDAINKCKAIKQIFKNEFNLL